MVSPLNGVWGFENVTAEKLNKTTYGSGTADERNAITSWPPNRLFFDTTEGQLYRSSVLDNILYWTRIPREEQVGTVKMFAGNRARMIREGYLLCDGRAISRDEYFFLFINLGTRYGDGDGSTTFNLPDFRYRFPRGVGPTGESGLISGTDTVSLTRNTNANTIPSFARLEFLEVFFIIKT